MVGNKKLIIANCSGFYGDRISAAKEMVSQGPIDVLTGDYLAELTMAILFRKQLKDPNGGYASTFLRQMEDVMGTCLDKNIRVVSNAGGLNPKSLAHELGKIAEKLGLSPKIAYIKGDNLMGSLDDFMDNGEEFIHMDKNISLKDAGAQTISANAYFGGWGVTQALNQGADIVVGGRLADAALVSGPCAWKFNWKRDDYDKLAGAVAAGHIIECGTQATGGNYSFFKEVPSFLNVGFPIAEMHEDGSFVITKHDNTGGLVSTGTVTAQLLYEIRGHQYLTPDVTARFDTIKLETQGKDRVYVSGIKGESPTNTTKVCINNLGGYRNSMTIILTGLDIEEKAEIVLDTLFESMGGKDIFEVCEVQLIRSDQVDPQTNEASFALLRVSVMDKDQKLVGRLFSSKIVELALSSVPGFTLTSPPSNAMPAIVHWPALVSKEKLKEILVIDNQEQEIKPVLFDESAGVVVNETAVFGKKDFGKMEKAVLGSVFATRSGDKGGNANLGVWAKNRDAFEYLKSYLTVGKLKELLTDMSEFEIEKYEFENLYAVNFYIKGILGDGVAASLRSDPQGKTLGEYLRAKIIDLPKSIL